MADPANTPLGKMLLVEITPVVTVLRTPLVEEACQKNGLSLVQMLRPFCVFNNFDVPVRRVSDQSYRLQEFRLRLFYDSDIRPPNLEPMLEAWARQLVEHISNSGCSRPLMLSLGLKDHSAVTMKGIVSAVIENRLW